MPAGNEIKRLRIKAQKSAAEVAALMGVNAERLRKWEQRDVDPKDSADINRVEKFFGTSLDNLSKLNEFDFGQDGTKRDSGEEYWHEKNDLTNQTILNLAESNRIMAEANKVQSEANRIQAESNRLLSESNKQLVDYITAGAGAEIPANVAARFEDLLELIAEVASGSKFHSQQEAAAVLRKRFYDTIQNTL